MVRLWTGLETNDNSIFRGRSMISAARIAACAAVLSMSSAAIHAAPQPIEGFARMPQIRNVSISPDGRHVAFISSLGDVSVLMTFDRSGAGSEFRQVAASEPGKFDLNWCRWANNQRLLCSLEGNIRGRKYAEPPYSRLIGVNADGKDLKVLQLRPDKANTVAATTTMQNFRMNEGTNVPDGIRTSDFRENPMRQSSADARINTKAVALYNPEKQDGVIDVTPDQHDSVLIQVDDDRDSYPTVFALDIYSGQRGIVLNENPPISNFATDGKGNVRLGWGTTENLNTYYFARLEGEREWHQLSAVEAFATTDALRPLAVAPWKNTAYAVGDYQGRDALWTIDLADKEEPRLLFNHPLVDVGEPLLTQDKRLLGIRYDVERPYAYYETEMLRNMVDRMQKQFPAKFHHVVDSTEDEKTFIVQSSSDVDYGTYYIYDTAKDLLQKLGTAYPELNPETLGRMTNIVYKAADGTEIPGYLTVPSGVRAEKLPLVVLPHDGPAARDTWQFSFLRTFLANRGYAVLQMNFRGSAGYGQKWQLAAHQDWGGLSYSDIVDATRWAINEGIADPKRICIAGWGFGGYAAMLGAVRNGELYRCSISIAGISDLDLHREHAAVHLDAEYRREQIGSDREKLRKDSPLQHVEDISTPILMVHGDKDWEVQVDQTKAMAKELKRHKKPHEAVIIEAATHELARKSDRETLLEEVEAFLLEHLGKGAQANAEQPS
jgi:dipeptidyl aminopeptidase/acylaminoacyl peptidase